MLKDRDFYGKNPRGAPNARLVGEGVRGVLCRLSAKSARWPVGVGVGVGETLIVVRLCRMHTNVTTLHLGATSTTIKTSGIGRASVA